MMNGTRLVVAIALLGAPVISGCASQPEQPSVHALSGHVNLTGFLLDAGGKFVGTRVVRDADGVPIDLLRGTQVAGHTVTVKGVYRFEGLTPGGYIARTRVVGDIGDDTNLLTIASSDVAAADTLDVVSVGDLSSVPNPVGASTTLYFTLTGTEQVEVQILDMGGDVIRPLFSGELLPGLRAFTWNVDDLSGHPATQPYYWATVVDGADVRVQLLFLGP